MKVRIEKWGDSLVVRIPKRIATRAGLEANHECDLLVDGGTIIIARRKRYTLRSLLAGVTAQNRHGETQTGPAVAKEAW
jgi:antitoxin MazE